MYSANLEGAAPILHLRYYLLLLLVLLIAALLVAVVEDQITVTTTMFLEVTFLYIGVQTRQESLSQYLEQVYGNTFANIIRLNSTSGGISK